MAQTVRHRRTMRELIRLHLAAGLSDKTTRVREFRAQGLVVALIFTDMFQAQAKAPQTVRVRPDWERMIEQGSLA